MNAQRRKEISKIIRRIDNISPEIQGVIDDEQQSLDNMPENLEGSERYDTMENTISNLEEANTYINEIIVYLTEAMEA